MPGTMLSARYTRVTKTSTMSSVMELTNNGGDSYQINIRKYP